jgi:Fe-S cluster assembly protein SufD
MSEITPIRTPAEQALLARFPAVASSLPGNAAIETLRREAFARFAATGLPHRRVEKWKYTDLRAAMREAAPLADRPGASEQAAARALANPLASARAVTLVIVNGHFAPELSDLARLPDGVTVVDLAGALGSGHPLVADYLGRAAQADDPALALNAAFMAGGVILSVAVGTAIDTVVQLRFLGVADAPLALYPRALVAVGADASLTLIESHEGPDGVTYQANSVVEIIGGDRSKIEHVRYNAQGAAAIDLSSLGIIMGAEATLNSLNFVARPALARHQLFLQFAGENATANVAGASLLKGRQHADTTLFVDHAVPHCSSRELFKHVIDEEATGVFQGMILVRPIAQKTDGKMMSRAVLLHDGATMNNKPELEIYADDVQCGHGATCGALDEDMLFYIQSRGLPKHEAEGLMLAAFIGEALETIENEAVREALETVTRDWLMARA